MKAVNIDWDIDSGIDRACLPNEIDIPDGLEDEDEISEYLTSLTGFCHYEFELIKLEKDK